MDESRFERNVGVVLFGALLTAGASIALYALVPWENSTVQEHMSWPMVALWGAAAVGLSMLLFSLFRSQHHHDHDIRISDEDTLRRFEESDRAPQARKED